MYGFQENINVCIGLKNNLWNLSSQTIFTPSFSDLIKKMYFTNEKENKFVRKK